MGIFLASMIVLIAVAYYLLHYPKVQTYLTEKIAIYLSKLTNSEISVGSVDIVFFDKLSIKNISISTKTNDTLAHIEYIKGSLNFFDWRKKIVYFREFKVHGAKIHAQTDSLGILNFSSFLNAFSGSEPPDTSTMAWRLYCSKICFENANLSYHDLRKPHLTGKLDPNHIHVTDLNVEIKDFEIRDELTKVAVNKLSFKESCGFELKSFSAILLMDPIKLSIKNLLVHYGKTYLDAPLINLRNLTDTSPKGIPRFSYTAWINHSKIKPSDLKPILGNLVSAYRDPFEFSGEFKGNYTAIEGRKFKLTIGKKTLVLMDFSARDFSDIEKMRCILNVKRISTNYEDLTNLSFAKLELPGAVKNIGNFSLYGKVSYSPDTLKSKLTLETDGGSLISDFIVFKPLHSPVFSGNFSSPDFFLGKLIEDTDIIGNIRFNTKITGKIKNGIPDLEIDGIADYFEFNWVKIRNISINGLLHGKNFDGRIGVNDPNISFDFLGNVDLNNKLPVLDFTAEVFNAKPAMLNIGSLKDSITDVSFLLTATFSGENLENMNGEINLMNTEMIKGDKIYKLEDIGLSIAALPEVKNFSLTSSMLDIVLNGSFSFDQIGSQVNSFIKVFIPNFVPDSVAPALNLPGFNLTCNLKNIDPITKLFIPGLKVSHNSMAEGKYDKLSNNLNLTGKFGFINFEGNNFENTLFQMYSKNDQLFTLTEIKTASVAGIFKLNNFSINTSLKNDSLQANINWNNWGKITNSANITSNIYFLSDSNQNKEVKVEILPSNLVVNDTLFNIENGTVLFSRYSTLLQNIKLVNNDQFIKIWGMVSENNTDTLNINLNRINIAYLNLILNDPDFILNGILSGNIKLFTTDAVSVFESAMLLQEPAINKKNLGDINIDTKYISNEGKILIGLNQNSNNQQMHINGYYLPSYDSIHLKSILKNKDITFLNAFLGEIIPLKNGKGTGWLNVDGTFDQLNLNGALYADSAVVYIEEINVDFHFSDSIYIHPDGFVLNKIKMFDPENNVCVANGKVGHNNFDDWNLDLSFNTDQILGMNTNLMHNSTYYGKAYAAGVIKISGPVDDILFDMSFKTLKNTKIYFPLSETGEVEENSIVKFTSRVDEAAFQNKHEIELSGMEFKINLEITTDAEIQLIFDPKVGDIIKARGNGKMNLAIPKMGEMSMFGDYTMENGDYLFTLQDVINKKFEIEKGSSITWKGDPYDALINFDAVYKLKKVNLFDLTNAEEDMEKRLPVNCHLLMSNTLYSPNIRFKINFVYGNQVDQLQEQLDALAEEDINKQVISLLLINKFQKLPNAQTNTNTENVSASGVSTNASELLSSQLSNWLSQISNDFDLGFKYRPGDQITTEEMEMAFSTQFFNDRVSLSTNVGVGGQQNLSSSSQNASAVAGDVLLEAKISKSGKLRAKYYTRSNKDLIYESSPYTHGVGISYREDFNTFGELMQRYWYSITKPRKPKQENTPPENK